MRLEPSCQLPEERGGRKGAWGLGIVWKLFLSEGKESLSLSFGKIKYKTAQWVQLLIRSGLRTVKIKPLVALSRSAA